MAGEAGLLALPFTPEAQLTRCMRLRFQSLQQKRLRPQPGEKLLQPNEQLYRVDFTRQHDLRFLRWDVQLEGPGKLTLTGTSQHWTPDLTHLMNRQLLEPAGIFWKQAGAKEVQCNEAEAQELGERIAELAQVRKVMYFLLAFTEGLEPAQLRASIVFKA
ncbi:olfactory marker protein [Pogoniulus pusillus]|uniref:olfactory marker protein n=1 Tax=Pogoniulus pusillus TaxID=488313 RepID=UPI0030B96FE2